jgi:hypothetical protein
LCEGGCDCGCDLCIVVMELARLRGRQVVRVSRAQLPSHPLQLQAAANTYTHAQPALF